MDNQNHKTICYLKSKVWYRFLKVLFLSAIVLMLAGLNVVAFSGGIKRVDRNKTTIQCNLGTKNSFTTQGMVLSLNSSNFPNGQFNYKGYFDGQHDYNVAVILEKCYPKREASFNNDIYDSQAYAEVDNKLGLVNVSSTLSEEQGNALVAEYNSNYGQETKGLIGSAKARYLNFDFHMFDITPAFTYNKFLELFFLGNLIILLVFEIIRRMFYYIVLGSIKPRK